MSSIASLGRTGANRTLGELVDAAREGDRIAWNGLVKRLERVVWKAVNMATADSHVRDDAFVATWLRLAERLATIREPEKLPGWLTTTAVNEVRQIVRHRDRLAPVANIEAFQHNYGADPDEVVSALIDAEDHARVRHAFHRLDAACREVLTVLVMNADNVPYDEAAVELGRPVGSLGPTRRRCLDKVRILLMEDAQS